MTVFVASVFLPYTIDFQATESRHARRTSSNGHGSIDSSVVGRLADARRQRRKTLSFSMTPGATTDDERIFKSYVSRSAGEIPIADDPNGPRPSEPRSVSWGQSRKFNQPPPKALIHPAPSILSRSGGDQIDGQFAADGSLTNPEPEEGHSPRAALSDMDWVVKAAEQGNGGLRNAVHAAVDAGLLTDQMWVGTLGMPTDLLKDETRASISETLEDEFNSLTVFVDDHEFQGHYSHFCRTVLWPAFHYQMQESPRHTEYDDYSWKQYVKVNEAFANTILAHWRPGDSIWINDYHLLLLPTLLREKLPHVKIGFFMHAAFPSSEVFRCLTARNSMINGLLGSDLIGFQTDEYCHHFLHTCSRLLGLEVSVDGVQLRDRFVRVQTLPFGVDPNSLDELRQSTEVKNWIANIRSRYEGKHLIVARDRLDGPGGIKQKLLGYELFLKRYPKWRENVVLIQVSSSNSEIPELEAQVSKIAMRVNSVYSTLTHQPLVLLRQDISYSQFLALMSVAEIFMVTSLREGMNLTSHDYINCQDGRISNQCHGSLILSEFTGSASIFSGHDLLVNPWDYQQCADAINKALDMSPEEKWKNWEFLMDKKAPFTATGWCESFGKALDAAHSAQLSREPSHLSALSLDALQQSYGTSSLRLFLLEDESTTAPANSVPSEKAIAQLEVLLQDPKNVVYITSSKSSEQLRSLLPDLPPTVGLITENGCFLRGNGAATWEELFDATKTKDWRDGIRRVVEYFQERTEGSWVEERGSSLTFRYDQAQDPEIASRQASDLADQINGSRGNEAIRVVLTQGTVSFEPLDVTKATAAEIAFQRLPKTPDFVFVAGGARGDEALFRWANQLVIDGRAPNVTTLTVGHHATEAKAVLPDDLNISDVLGDLCVAGSGK
ncbi:hypothetical protein ASPZODRAFT_65292 [Penicilliopsis zonata CBS 506.65]|uniref:Alpha,alpha-trehalose phosphate synthase subunit n=1 Tax=Penicilliopsis zonata CBS 506.65 TaxID=1073090 RepID=A0A1L9SIL1_9EURO|nr:hypothetical protein ASPZODRAFT_65292 [Penicilliopsis zonata CBS 506.65]OJJ46941.1 hypothetical protein ASPZODRAFT_65292 [Penicilliopsis zonata CBS 506.65]